MLTYQAFCGLVAAILLYHVYSSTIPSSTTSTSTTTSTTSSQDFWRMIASRTNVTPSVSLESTTSTSVFVHFARHGTWFHYVAYILLVISTLLLLCMACNFEAVRLLADSCYTSRARVQPTVTHIPHQDYHPMMNHPGFRQRQLEEQQRAREGAEEIEMNAIQREAVPIAVVRPNERQQRARGGIPEEIELHDTRREAAPVAVIQPNAPRAPDGRVHQQEARSRVPSRQQPGPRYVPIRPLTPPPSTSQLADAPGSSNVHQDQAQPNTSRQENVASVTHQQAQSEERSLRPRNQSRNQIAPLNDASGSTVPPSAERGVNTRSRSRSNRGRGNASVAPDRRSRSGSADERTNPTRNTRSSRNNGEKR